MEYDQIYITALDLVVETCLNHQKLETSLPYLKDICTLYDSFYSTSTFNETLKGRIALYKKLLINDEETLFIVKSHIPYLIKQNKLILEEDRFKVYIIILYWVKQFNLPNPEIYFKLASVLSLNETHSQQIEDFIFNKNEIAKSLNFLSLKPNHEDQLEKLEGNWVESNKPEELLSDELFSSTEIKHTLDALYLPNRKAFLLKCEEQSYKLKKNLKSHPDSFCFLKLGDNLCFDETTIVSFTELKKKLIEKLYSKQLVLTAENAELLYKNQKGIKAFNLSAYPGQLIGVIGKEGSGKSSLLKMLAGVAPPSNGCIYINAYNLFQNKYQLSGIIGYVPEEDLLFSELTAFQNIEFVAKLHLEKTLISERNKLIRSILEELEITEIQDKRVGDIEEKAIQPGQRRLLNIALELVRDPQILIVDNAKSGLSLSEASHVVNLLSKYTFKGKLIITSITQTGKDSFDNFDKLFVLNENGYTYFYGPINQAIKYFLENLPEGIKKEYEDLNSITSLEILELINRKEIFKSKKRHLLSENYLYKRFYSESEKEIVDVKKRNKLPGINTPPPRLEKQYLTYTIRNFSIKWAKKRELVYTILAAPILAAILSMILRSGTSATYSFHSNDNIPVYFFLSIVVNIFLGLSQSAKEIIGEKNILQKEERINLSLFSYINSKISYLIIILLIQTLLYTIAGNFILRIKEMLFYHWIIYFSCGSAGVLLGLVFSSCHRSYETILLKTIPITLIIIILLGGGWVPLDRLKSTKNKYTPIASDLMISRWAFEAIMVQQFIANPYEKNYFNVDKEISNGAFNLYHILPLLSENLDFVNNNYKTDADSCNKLLLIIKNRIEHYTKTEDIFPFEFLDKLSIEYYNNSIATETMEYLNYLDYYFYRKYSAGIERKNKISDSLNTIYGNSYQKELEHKNSNHAVIQKVRNGNTRKPYTIINDDIVQLSEPIFQLPNNEFGRAQLFSSVKKFNQQQFTTLEFNLSIIWMINLFVYILLITNSPQKILLFYSNFNSNRFAK